jgi:hypothetical protein
VFCPALGGEIAKAFKTHNTTVRNIKFSEAVVSSGAVKKLKIFFDPFICFAVGHYS